MTINERFRRVCGCCWLVLGMVGCSGDQEPGPSGAAGAGSPSAVGGGGAGSTAGAGSNDAGGSGGNAQGGNPAGGAGGAAALAPLIPLVPGHTWSFAFKAIDSTAPARETCADPRAEVGEQTTIAGKTGYLYTTPCGTDPYLVEGSGDQLMAHRLVQGAITSTYEYIHSPVAEGEQWMTNGALYEWRRITAKLDLPAGSFDDCWERHSEDLNLVYCRGVGLARMTSRPNNYVLELTERNF